MPLRCVPDGREMAIGQGKTADAGECFYCAALFQARSGSDHPVVFCLLPFFQKNLQTKYGEQRFLIILRGVRGTEFLPQRGAKGLKGFIPVEDVGLKQTMLFCGCLQPHCPAVLWAFIVHQQVG